MSSKSPPITKQDEPFLKKTFNLCSSLKKTSFHCTNIQGHNKSNVRNKNDITRNDTHQADSNKSNAARGTNHFPLSHQDRSHGSRRFSKTADGQKTPDTGAPICQLHCSGKLLEIPKYSTSDPHVVGRNKEHGTSNSLSDLRGSPVFEQHRTQGPSDYVKCVNVMGNEWRADFIQSRNFTETKILNECWRTENSAADTNDNLQCDARDLKTEARDNKSTSTYHQELKMLTTEKTISSGQDRDEDKKRFQFLLSEHQKVTERMYQITEMLSCKGKDDDFFDDELSKEDSLKHTYFAMRSLRPDEIVIEAEPLLLDLFVYSHPLAERLKYECLRLATFSTRTNLAVSPIRLAFNGFYFSEELGVYKCFSCDVEVEEWDPTQKNIEIVHLRLSPNCDHANHRDRTNVFINPEDAALLGNDQTDETDGISQSSSCPSSSGAFNGGAAAAGRKKHDAANSSKIQRDGQPASKFSSDQPHQNGTGAAQNSSVSVPRTRLPLASAEALSGQQHGQQLQQQQQQQHLQVAGTETDGETVRSPRPASSAARGSATFLASSSSTRRAGVSPAPSAARAAPASANSRPPTAAPSSIRTVQDSEATNSSQSGGPSGSLQSTYPGGQNQTGSAPDFAAVGTELVGLDKRRAASPKNCSATARYATFGGWPAQGLPHPRDMVIAGFYYTGSGDCVRCFFCGVTMRNWGEHDDPWIMHVRFRFSCEYVVAVKGERFVMEAYSAAARGRTIRDGADMSTPTQSSAATPDSSSAQMSTATVQPPAAPRSNSDPAVVAPAVSGPRSAVNTHTGAHATNRNSTATANPTAAGNSTAAGYSAATGNSTAVGNGTATGNSTITDTLAGHSLVGTLFNTASPTGWPGKSATTTDTRYGTSPAVATSTCNGSFTAKPRPNADSATDSGCADSGPPATAAAADSGRSPTATYSERPPANTDFERPNTATNSESPATATDSERPSAAAGSERAANTSPRQTSPRRRTTRTQTHNRNRNTPSPSCQSTVTKESPSTTRQSNAAEVCVAVDGGAAQVNEAEYRELERTNRNLRRSMRCRICEVRDVDIIFLPCGHLCACQSCGNTITRCCLCNVIIGGTARVNLMD